MKLYFAHHISDYGKARERIAVKRLTRRGFDVVNPNHPTHSAAYKRDGMDYFVRLVQSLDALAFQRFTAGDIGAGVGKEIQAAFSAGLPVYELVRDELHTVELPPASLSVAETRIRLKALRGETLKCLSFGGGVQSTTLAQMAAAGELEKPDFGIFADTQWEPKKVYAHVEALRHTLPFPLFTVTRGSLRQAVLDRRNSQGGRFAAVPWFIVNPDGSKGMGRRQCSSEYKLTPIMWELRRLLGVGRKASIRKGAVEVWLGISTDEAARMKPSKQQWQINRFPLIERNMSRDDCLAWMSHRGLPMPPKSACVGCPFHNNAYWRDMQDNSPDEWADAVLVDSELRKGSNRGTRGTEYMHRQCVPLSEVDFTSRPGDKVNNFVNECDGRCAL